MLANAYPNEADFLLIPDGDSGSKSIPCRVFLLQPLLRFERETLQSVLTLSAH